MLKVGKVITAATTMVPTVTHVSFVVPSGSVLGKKVAQALFEKES